MFYDAMRRDGDGCRSSSAGAIRRLSPAVAFGVALALVLPTPPAAVGRTRTEITRLRTATSETFRTASGAYELRIFSRPVNYRDAHGRWRRIDNRLYADGRFLRNRANGVRLEIPRRLGRAPLRLTRGDAWISFSPIGASGRASFRGATAQFRGAWSGVALRYTATDDGVRQALVIRRRSDAAHDFSFVLRTAPGDRLVALDSGAIALRGPQGIRRMLLSPSEMVDRSGAEHAVPSTLRPTRAGWRLTLRPDRRWLAGPRRRWPVTIDPDIAVGPALACSIGFDEITGDKPHFCGSDLPVQDYCNPYSCHWYRSLVRFDVQTPPLLRGADIVSVSLREQSDLPMPPAYVINRHWDENASWDGPTADEYWDGWGGDFDYDPNAPVTDFTSLVKNWRGGFQSNDGVILVTRTHQPSPPINPYLDVVFLPDVGVRDNESFDTYDVGDGQRLRVNLATGNLVAQAVDVPTLGVPDGPDEDALDSWAPIASSVGARTWNSLDPAADGSFGSGWRLGGGTDVRLLDDGEGNGNRVLTAPGGYSVVFERNTDGTFTAPGSHPGTSVAYPGSLVVHGDGTATVTTPAGDTLDFSPSSGGTGGYLTQWTSAGGVAATYSSNGDANASETDPAGVVTTFTGTSPGSREIATISTPDGDYAYTYSAGRLASVTGPSGAETSYGYTNGLLTSIDQPAGADDWGISYYGDGRVSAVTDTPPTGASSVTTYSYGEDATTATYPDGAATYELDATRTYAAEVDSGSGAPTIGMSGSLVGSAPSLAATGQYDLSLSVTDADGIALVAVRLDGSLQAGSGQACPSSPCTLDDFYTLDADTVGPGVHNIDVIAADTAGNQRVKRFWVSVPLPTLGDQPADPTYDPTSDEAIAQAIQFRQDEGLDASEAHVRAVQGDEANASAWSRFGVYLTPSEVTSVETHLDVDRATPVIDNYGAGHPDEYADLYVDPDAIVHVGFTGHTSEHLAALQAIFPYPDRLTVFTAQYTRDDLLRVLTEITDDRDSLRAQGIDVGNVEQRTEQNDVLVGVHGLTADDTAYLRAHYGPEVSTAEAADWTLTAGEEEARSAYVRPLKAGLLIHDQRTGTDCTSAFSAIGRPPLPDVVYRGQRKRFTGYYILTAGHCANGVDLGGWSQGGKACCATTEFLDFHNGASADAILLSSNSPHFLSPWIYLGKRAHLRPMNQKITGAEDAETDDTGHSVCMSGIISGFRCGRIIHSRASAEFDLEDQYGNVIRSAAFFNLRVASFGCAKGDSGAPVFEDRQHSTSVLAIGIVMAGSRTSCVFGHIGHALSDLAHKYDIADLHLVVAPGGR
jgi:hypothetical protein